jgi:YVTN family beta-propeller protein
LYCKNCGKELPSPDADICINCGKLLEKSKATESFSEPAKRPSKAWYLVPIFFGIMGGLIMYLVLKDENMRMAKKGLVLGIILGAVLTASVIIFYAVIFGVMFHQVFNPGILKQTSNISLCTADNPQNICQNLTLNSNGLLTAQIGYGPGLKNVITGYGCSNTSLPPLSFLPKNFLYDSTDLPIKTFNATFSCPLTSNALGSSFSGTLWARYHDPDSKVSFVRMLGTFDANVTNVASGIVIPNQSVAIIPVDIYPYAIVPTPNGKYVYEANEMGKIVNQSGVFSYIHTVSVIDTKTNNVVTSIPVGNFPRGMAILPNGNYIYVTNRDDNSVSVIDTTINKVTTNIHVGIQPYGIAVTPNGKYLYVANSGNSTVSIINTSTNNVITTIEVKSNPQFIAFSPNGQYVYIDYAHDNSISKIDTATNTFTANISVGAEPQDIVISPDGNYVYVANFGDKTVSVISTVTDKVVTTIPVELNPYGMAMTPDGKYLYVVNSGNIMPIINSPLGSSVSVINTAANTVDEFFIVGNEPGPGTIFVNPEGVAITSDGKFAYITNTNIDTVSVFSTGSYN